jgi:hypothetical protein
MKLAFIFTFMVASISSCPKQSKSLFDDACPLSYKLEWTVVEEGTDVEKQIELLSRLSASAKADADRLNQMIGNLDAQAKFDAKFELAKTLQETSIKKASVSQSIFDEYVKVRTASCNLWDAIKNGFYGNDDEAIKEARDLFTKIQQKFSEIEKPNFASTQISIENVQIINNYATTSVNEETKPTIIIEI